MKGIMREIAVRITCDLQDKSDSICNMMLVKLHDESQELTFCQEKARKPA